MVCLHGFMDTWRTWKLVLPMLERRRDVLAPTLPGHAGGPQLVGEVTSATILDSVERAMDETGFDLAHIVGNSLGGYVALQLAARGRAKSVVALAPAGGWADNAYEETLEYQKSLQRLSKAAAPFADAIVASKKGRRGATEMITSNYEHIPAELIAHLMSGVAACKGAGPLIENALREGWTLDAEKITCPVRVLWGAEDKLLPWPSAAARYRDEWLVQADWVVLDGVGHCPQLDVPLETVQLILGFTAE